MNKIDLEQLVFAIKFAGLTPAQENALEKIVGALQAQQAAAAPFGVLAERFTAYRRICDGVSPKHLLDFTEWLDRYGEDADILLAQCRAVAGKKGT